MKQPVWLYFTLDPAKPTSPQIAQYSARFVVRKVAGGLPPTTLAIHPADETLVLSDAAQRLKLRLTHNPRLPLGTLALGNPPVR